MSKEKKRSKVTYKRPNPLFEKWLEEWRDEAALRNTNLHYCYSKALRSLRKYPLPLKSGKECLILENFGQGLCAKLEKKLAEYRKSNPHSDSDDVSDIAPSVSAFVVNNRQKADKPAKKRKLSDDKAAFSVSPARKKQERTYVPAYRSGAYALLVTLYTRHSQPNYPGFMTKAELQKSAQALCDASFYKPDPGSYYTAWSSMSTLIKKALVSKTGQPARFSLTDEGMALAIQLEEADSSSTQNSASGSKQDQSQSSSSCRSTTAKTKVTHRKSTKKRSTTSYTYASEEEDDPGYPDSSPENSHQSKPTSANKTSHIFESRKTENFSCSSRMSPLAMRKYSLSSDEDIPTFSVSPPRKPEKKLSPIPNSYNLSEFEDEPESLDNLRESLFDHEPVVLKNVPQMCNKHSDKSLKNMSLNSNLSNKITNISIEISDSDDDSKKSSFPPKEECPKHNFSNDKPKQSRAREAHDLSETEDDSFLFSSSSKQQKKTVKRASDKSTFYYSLSEDESDEDIKTSLPSVRLSSQNINLSKKDGRSAASTSSAKSYDKTSSTDENSVSSFDFKAPKRRDISPDTSDEAVKSRVSKNLAKSSKTKSNGLSLENDDASLYPSTDRPETISDLYFGNNDDDYLMTQIDLDRPESPKLQNVPKFQDKPPQSSSQTSSSACSTKSSSSKGSSEKYSEGSLSSSQPADFHILMPGTFDVILIVDNQESKRGMQKPFLLELDNLGTNYEVRHLKIGDYIWVARCKTTNVEVVLPYIIERKRMDDLGQSIKDGRFHEQKIRLKQSGIEKLIYLVEIYGGNYGLPETTVHQAAVNTYVVDKFQLKYTSDYKHSASYLSTLTRLISKQFKDKTIASCDKNSLPNFDVCSDFVSLMTFKDFSKGMSKTRNYTVKEMFIKSLLQLHGMSVEKASAITARYPTPKSLLKAYKNGGGEGMLASLTFGPMKRSVGPVLSKNVYQLYTSKNFP